VTKQKERNPIMGMFDKETQLKNAEFASGEFMLYSGEFLGNVKHAEYGDNTKARVRAGVVGGSQVDAEEYVVFGVMAEQVGRISSGDLPQKVRIGQDGRANVLVKAEE
jgi:hypothetical protein